MAIPSKGFEVIFTQKYGTQEDAIPVEHFFSSELDFNEKRENEMIEIREYRGLALTFRSDDHRSRLFMDGLDTLPEEWIKLDPSQGEAYLPPSDEPVTIYDHTREYYPLIPGFYRLAVEHGGRRYFSWIKVLPKQLGEDQLEVMREEIERELQGLARDIVLRKKGLNSGLETVSQQLLEEFMVIHHHFPSVMAALSDLYRRINYRISKEYMLVPKEKSRNLDEKTIRHRLSRPEKEHVLKTPISAIMYDLPENRLVKKIIRSISQTLSGFVDEIERIEHGILNGEDAGVFRSTKEKENTLAELAELMEKARKMRGAFQWMKTASWYGEVGDVYLSSSLPHVMNSDPRYRALYQLYRELNQESFQQLLRDSYSYQWKRTDKLYEIWGYLQFLKALEEAELGFKAESGWIYSDGYSGGSGAMLMPALPANTKVVFRKGEIKLHLIYESLLPTQSRKTDPLNPLYTRGTHTCPDGRMDVFLEEKFMGSVIFDLKYRPRNSIWDEGLLASNQQNNTMRQLVSYGDNLHSLYLFGGGAGKNPWFQNMSPVQEVWAIYPNRYSSQKCYEYPDHKVSLVELTPSMDRTHLSGKIKTAIESLIERYQSIMAIQKIF